MTLAAGSALAAATGDARCSDALLVLLDRDSGGALGNNDGDKLAVPVSVVAWNAGDASTLKLMLFTSGECVGLLRRGSHRTHWANRQKYLRKAGQRVDQACLLH